MRGTSPALAVVASRPRIVPRPRARSIPRPPPAVDAQSVLAYLGDLPASERAALLARAVGPVELVPHGSTPSPAPDETTGADAAPFELTPRATLRSVDLEVILDTRTHLSSASSRSTVPPPLPSRARPFRRLLETPPESHSELMADVVTSLADLSFFGTAATAASFCLVTAMRVIPSLAGLALVRDYEKGGYLVVYARGPRGFEVVRTRCGEDDRTIAESLTRGGPVAIDYGNHRPPPSRHAIFGDPWTVFVALAQDGAQCTAAIELIDPIDGRDLDDAARRVLATIAKHLTIFARGLPRTTGDVFAPEQLGLSD